MKQILYVVWQNQKVVWYGRDKRRAQNILEGLEGSTALETYEGKTVRIAEENLFRTLAQLAGHYIKASTTP